MSIGYIILERHIISTGVSEQIPVLQLTVDCPNPCLPALGSPVFLLRSFFGVLSSLFTMIADGFFGLVLTLLLPLKSSAACLVQF